jgi:hypothetical protein
MLAAMVGDEYQYDPNKASESFERSPYVETQRAALRDAQAQPEDALFEGAFVDNIDRGVDELGLGSDPEVGALFGADPENNAAMQAALIGKIETPLGYAGDRGGLPASTEELELAAYAGSAEERAAQERAHRATVNTPDAVAARMAELVASNPDIAKDPAYAQWVQSNLARKQALVDEQRKHEQAIELKGVGPATAGAKPGTPYEVNGRLVQDYIDASGNWATRDVGAAAPHTYSGREGTALQYTDRMTELRAQIAAIPDENSPERIVLEQELDDLLYNVARDPGALGEVSRVKALEGARGTTAEEREKNKRGIRAGIGIKHDRLPMLKNTTNQLKELAKGLFTSGLLGSIASMNPSSDQYQMNKLIKNIHAAVGLEELIAVKARGATFGALSDTEMELLIASIQSLDPLLPKEVLSENLDNVMRLYEKGLNTAKKDFVEIYGEDERRPWEPPPGSGIPQQEWDGFSAEEKAAMEPGA